MMQTKYICKYQKGDLMFTTSVSVYMDNQDGRRLEYIEGEGLSTDTKPTEGIANGSKFMEMDTSTLYMFDLSSKTWIAWQ